MTPAPLHRLIGTNVVAVDPHPEIDGALVVTVRPVGRSARRHIAMVAVDGAVVVSELAPGCRVLRRLGQGRAAS